jgi:serine/threonine protein kinase
MGLRLDLRPAFDIPQIVDEQLLLDKRLLPKQLIDHKLRVFEKGACVKIRAELQTHGILNEGTYGQILHGVRDKKHSVVIKKPKHTTHSLEQEALTQHLVFLTLESAGIRGAISRVYDIYEYAGEVRFSMEHIHGVSSIQFLLQSSDPVSVLVEILSQVAFLLAFLEQTLHLDHRDLKPTNLWIRSTPVQYRGVIGGEVWEIRSPFQVVLLDFGFACIGSSVNVGRDIFPDIDPCPKEGRDLFQFLISMWSVKEVRSLLPTSLHGCIDELLKYQSISYSDLAQQTPHSTWSYLVVANPTFSHPPLHPRNVLWKLADINPTGVRRLE